ncbi:unnamed protein product, partial [Lampetra planeri]
DAVASRLKKRLSFVREFTAAGGDKVAFQCCFVAACSLAEWTEEEALRALPTALDDDALAALDAIPDEQKTKMGAIFAPASAKRHKVSTRKRGEAEMPLAYHCALWCPPGRPSPGWIRTSDDEDDELIPQTVPGMATPEKGSEAPSVEQRIERPCDNSPPSGREHRTAHSRLTELLQAAASIVTELHCEEPAVEERAMEPHGTEQPTAISCQQGTSMAQPTHAAAILEERSEEPATSEAVSSSPVDIPFLR